MSFSRVRVNAVAIMSPPWKWFFLAVLLLTGGILFLVRPVEKSTNEDILLRSRAYIELLGSLPFDELPREQKLTLFHAYYNVGDYAQTIRLGERLKHEILGLPKERREAFQAMLHEAYVRRGEL